MVLENIENKDSSTRGGSRSRSGGSNNQSSPWNLPLLRRIQMALQSHKPGQQSVEGACAEDEANAKLAESPDQVTLKSGGGPLAGEACDPIKHENNDDGAASTSTEGTEPLLSGTTSGDRSHDDEGSPPNISAILTDVDQVKHVCNMQGLVEMAVAPDATDMSESGMSTIPEQGFVSDSNASVSSLTSTAAVCQHDSASTHNPDEMESSDKKCNPVVRDDEVASDQQDTKECQPGPPEESAVPAELSKPAVVRAKRRGCSSKFQQRSMQPIVPLVNENTSEDPTEHEPQTTLPESTDKVAATQRDTTECESGPPGDDCGMEKVSSEDAVPGEMTGSAVAEAEQEGPTSNSEHFTQSSAPLLDTETCTDSRSTQLEQQLVTPGCVLLGVDGGKVGATKEEARDISSAPPEDNERGGDACSGDTGLCEAPLLAVVEAKPKGRSSKSKRRSMQLPAPLLHTDLCNVQKANPTDSSELTNTQANLENAQPESSTSMSVNQSECIDRVVDSVASTNDVQIPRRGRTSRRAKCVAASLPEPPHPSEIETDSNPSSEVSSYTDSSGSYTCLLEPGTLSERSHEEVEEKLSPHVPPTTLPESPLCHESTSCDPVGVSSQDILQDTGTNSALECSKEAVPPSKASKRAERPKRGRRRSMPLRGSTLSDENCGVSSSPVTTDERVDVQQAPSPANTVDLSRRIDKKKKRRGVKHRRQSAQLSAPLPPINDETKEEFPEQCAVDDTAGTGQEVLCDGNTVTISRGSSASAKRGRRRAKSPNESCANQPHVDCNTGDAEMSTPKDLDEADPPHDAPPSAPITSRRGGRSSRAKRLTASRSKSFSDDPLLSSDSSNDSTLGNNSATAGEVAGPPPVMTMPPELQDVLREEDFIKLMADDPDLPPLGGETVISEEPIKPKSKRGRRRSSDYHLSPSNILISPSQFVGDDSEEVKLGDLPELPIRRSGRIKRRSIEIFRRGLIEEDEPMDTPTPPDTKHQHKNVESLTDPPITNLKPTLDQYNEIKDGDENSAVVASSPVDKLLGDASPSNDLGTATNSQKVTKRSRKRRNEASVEDIYLNKLWRSQMPGEKMWETIYEQPQVKFNNERYQSLKRSKRHINFDDFHTKARLKRRRQRAVKNGWKPFTKQKEEKAIRLLDDRLPLLESLDSSMGEEDKQDSTEPCEAGYSKDISTCEIDECDSESMSLTCRESLQSGATDSSLLGSCDNTLIGVSADNTLIHEPDEVETGDSTSQQGQDLKSHECAPPSESTVESCSIDTPMKLDPDADTDIFYTPARSLADLAKFSALDEQVSETSLPGLDGDVSTPDVSQSPSSSVSPGY